MFLQNFVVCFSHWMAHIPEGSVLIIFIPTYLAYMLNSSHEILRI